MRLEQLTAGTLAQQLPDTSNVKELILSGEINGEDVSLLRSMCGCEGSKACPHPPVLERLDLSGVRIVAGGFAEDVRAVTERDEIGSYMFSKAQSLKVILLPRGLRKIGGKAFFGARQLEEVISGDLLSEIGEMAFMNCVSLESLSLGSAPLRIDRFAFGSCRRLNRISLRAEIPPEVDPTAFPSGVVLSCSEGAHASENKEPEVSEEESRRKTELTAIVSGLEQHTREKENQPDVWVETMTVQDRYSIQNGGSAALVLSCVTKRLKDVPVRVEARLFRSDGSPLKDTNKEFCLSGDQVGVETVLNPKFDKSQFSRIVLPLPYTEFHLGGVPEMLEWRVSFFADGQPVGKESRCPYSWSGPSCVRVTSFRLQGGAGYLDGIISFKANNCAGKNGKCVLFLFHENGNPVKDKNGAFCTTDGQVCSSAAFSPKYASAQFSDFRMRLPLSEFHLDGVKTRLKLLVQVFVENVPLAMTDPIVIKWNL